MADDHYNRPDDILQPRADALTPVSYGARYSNKGTYVQLGIFYLVSGIYPHHVEKV